jgi:phosphoribosyl-ATP pyrophosphohydrolase/phosphoribosyl-AMP cyclohydrolase
MRDRNAPLTPGDVPALAWDKMDGLLPAVVQDSASGQVLMLGYMDIKALEATLRDNLVTFFSRSRNSLWQKGETSGNRLALVSVLPDCDYDALLIKAEPEGPVCHLGSGSCFSEEGPTGVGFLAELARVVRDRASGGGESSYTARLLAEGPSRIAQKVGEEGVELALAAVSRDNEGCIDEAADLIYHLTVLMEARGFGWDDVAARLIERHR